MKICGETRNFVKV